MYSVPFDLEDLARDLRYNAKTANNRAAAVEALLDDARRFQRYPEERAKFAAKIHQAAAGNPSEDSKPWADAASIYYDHFTNDVYGQSRHPSKVQLATSIKRPFSSYGSATVLFGVAAILMAKAPRLGLILNAAGLLVSVGALRSNETLQEYNNEVRRRSFDRTESGVIEQGFVNMVTAQMDRIFDSKERNSAVKKLLITESDFFSDDRDKKQGRTANLEQRLAVFLWQAVKPFNEKETFLGRAVEDVRAQFRPPKSAEAKSYWASVRKTTKRTAPISFREIWRIKLSNLRPKPGPELAL